MGNNKFKLSDMIPNAWFYKLRDMSKNNTYKNKKPLNTPSTSSISTTSNSSSLFSSSISTTSNSISISIPPKNQTPQISHHRRSYYFTRELSPEESKSPNLEMKSRISSVKSPKQRTRTKGHGSSLEKLKSFDSHIDVSGSISENKSLNSPTGPRNIKIRNIGNRAWSEKPNSLTTATSHSGNSFSQTNFKSSDPIPDKKLQNYPIKSPTKRIRNRVQCNKPNSQVSIPTNLKESDTNSDGFYSISKTKLSPIITKKKTEAKMEKKISISKHSIIPTGVRLRSNSPRIGKVNEIGRKSFSSGRLRRLPETFAVVKSSSDPQKDFRESMVEMILQNKINGSTELEDLLASYLQLNSDKYHEMIIKVFKQIWFEIASVRVE